MCDISDIPITEIQFEGDQSSKIEAVKLLDRALKGQGDLGVYGNLSRGLKDLMVELNVRIEERPNRYFVEIYPKGAAEGHDFGFSICKETGEMSDVVIGEIVPEPDWDDPDLKGE